MWVWVCVFACARACVCVEKVDACVRPCVCTGACMYACGRVRAIMIFQKNQCQDRYIEFFFFSLVINDVIVYCILYSNPSALLVTHTTGTPNSERYTLVVAPPTVTLNTCFRPGGKESVVVIPAWVPV